MAIGFTIVATRAVSKINLVNQTGFLQVAQRVVNGCVADTGQSPARSFKDLAGSRMILTLLNHLKHRFSLGSQLWLFLCLLHNGFRLILNLRFVKRGLFCGFCAFLWLKFWVLASEVDDAVHVAFEWRTANTMRPEELLCLAGVVELADKEIRHRMMR